MWVDNDYRQFLAERFDLLVTATSHSDDGYRGRLLLRAGRDDVEAWRCDHPHTTQGLAFACAEAEKITLRGEREASRRRRR